MQRHSQQSLQLDLSTWRARLQGAQGPEYWRSLEELAGSPEFQQFVEREFPQQASEWHDTVSRRRFLQLMGASLALAGLSACSRQPEEKIVPYVRAPEGIVAGKAQYFATTMTLGGLALGVLAESTMGRPIKIEGNPQHPASLGATDAFAQASVLTLYDPDRLQAVVQGGGQISTWNAFATALRDALEPQIASGGAGLRLLTETITSPTMAQQLRALLTRFPAARWHQYEAVTDTTVQAGARLAFGQDVTPVYHFERAEVILALDADFLSCEPGNLRYAHDFAQKRRAVGDSRPDGSGRLQAPGGQPRAMNRLYVVESSLSLAGSVADHRLTMRPSVVPVFARAMAQALGAIAAGSAAPEGLEAQTAWIKAVAVDLQQHRGASLVLAGKHQPPPVHALAHAMNVALGNVGSTVTYITPVVAEPVDTVASLRTLVEDMAAGRVQLLVILGGNPVYTAPADIDVAAYLPKVPFRAHLSLYTNETSVLCGWQLPEAHYLEAWGDARAYDGTASFMQPLIAPLYDGKSAYELLALLLEQPQVSGREIVREYWRSQYQGTDFESFWRTALHDGVLANTAFPPQNVQLRTDWLPQVAALPVVLAGLELVFQPDPTVWDGRFANNGWLQELPKPITKLTWDNAALLSPATAQRFGLTSEAVVELRLQGRTVQAPVLLVPGHADDVVTISLGYGRWRTGRVGSGTGFNAYALRTSEALWVGHDLELRPTGARYPLAVTQNHHALEGRPLVRAGTLQQYLEQPQFVQAMGAPPQPQETLYPLYKYDGYAWGMAIDLTTCIGCNACVVACQAENNIPIVGKTEVLRGREMHWIRIDTYYQGAAQNPAVVHEPMLCVHCEHAPCEVVCPTYATVHDEEGLNNMVYNRCIGTRYCSNNCPYKVRRFNFFQYADYNAPSLKLLSNPEVTVRSRGVMEKCTYCIQRIQSARIQAKIQDRSIRDGEVVTACQAACPTGSIVFGNLNDPTSRVNLHKASPLNFGVLEELNTRPRTTYLAHLRNPNPQLLNEQG